MTTAVATYALISWLAASVVQLVVRRGSTREGDVRVTCDGCEARRWCWVVSGLAGRLVVVVVVVVVACWWCWCLSV